VTDPPRWLPLPEQVQGRLAVIVRPRGGHFLDDDLRALKHAGADTLVSALSVREEREVWLAEEHAHAHALGLTFHSVRIANMGIPRPEHERQIQELSVAVRNGARLVTHCYASVGRSPLIAASIMVILGVRPDDAWAAIAEARGLTVPDTTEQRLWVERFVRYQPP
jgi:predicted protein tyrosine phosphatase